ncbi:MAG: hypothetical protein AAGC93_04840 [Cyanobacteria bacterium P01_F01_bin.53]
MLHHILERFGPTPIELFSEHLPEHLPKQPSEQRSEHIIHRQLVTTIYV